MQAILSGNQNPKGILFDQESVVKNHRLAGLEERVQVTSGDFFAAVPHADLILMRTVIHDGDDASSLRTLANCRAALKPGGKILLSASSPRAWDRIQITDPHARSILFDQVKRRLPPV